jgi:hypothetical protein
MPKTDAAALGLLTINPNGERPMKLKSRLMLYTAAVALSANMRLCRD